MFFRKKSNEKSKFLYKILLAGKSSPLRSFWWCGIDLTPSELGERSKTSSHFPSCMDFGVFLLREEGKLQNPCMTENENLFWTVLRAQKELDRFRTTKMTAKASSFPLTKFYIKILIFHLTFFWKTCFQNEIRGWISGDGDARICKIAI